MNEISRAVKDAVILIPSLEPDERLPAYIRELEQSGFGKIVVVDDGSGEKFQPIFDLVREIPRTTVLTHEKNQGKGVALKTGYKYIQTLEDAITGVITADSDGQHTVTDCIRLAEMLGENNQALYLGSRDFNLPDIPPKSRSGNRITSTVFRALYGQWLPDTQTGLRAFRREELPFMINVEGERYEYEMKVLIACSRAHIPMIPVTIETIYENGKNEGTHFHPIKDSWRIYKVILGSFFKFMSSSLICTLIDQGLFNLLNLVVFSNGTAKDGSIILISTIIARVISSCTNFLLNWKYVFGQSKHPKKSFVRYIILSICIMLGSWAGTWLLGKTGMSSTLAKLITDTLLYLVSFKMQQIWVFREDA